MDISVSDAPVGRHLDGRYRIEALLARGGMATVYKAVDTRLDRLVALKVMHAELAADDDFVARFIGEARSVAKLSDPNVVNVFDQGEDDGAVYLAMEYIDGRTLRDVLHERGRLGAGLALEVTESVLSALAAAHRAGIVHRDVKPENVLVGNDGRVKVADFGLARALSSSSKTTRGLLGTVSYISPEQALGDKATTRSDVYSAGIMLYELLTGRAPHDGPTDFVVVRNHIDQDVPPPSDTVPSPPDVDYLVQSAAARRPEDRYADCSEFLEAVRAVRAQMSGTAAADPDATEAMDLSEIHAESRDSAGVTMHEALSDTIFAGQLLAAETVDERRDDEAGHPADTGEADPGHAAEQVDEPVRTADDAPPPPPPAPPSRTRVIHAPEADTSGDDDSGAHDHTAGRVRGRNGRNRTRSRRGLIMFVLVMLLAISVAVVAWWFGAGRWDTTPSLLDLPAEQAESVAAEAGFTATPGGEEFSEAVEAGRVLETDPGPGEKILGGGEITYVVSKGPERYQVPPLNGLTVDEATQQLAELSLEVRVTDEVHHEQVDEGRIVSQKVGAGEQVRRGAEVGVVVSLGRQPIEIEDFTGRSADDAESKLSEAGLEVDVSHEFSDDVDAGNVISQDPSEGTAFSGDTVEVVVSQGTEMVEVPGVVGERIDKAEEELRTAGFEVELVDLLKSPDNNGRGEGGGPKPRVVRVEPSGSSQPRGATLTLYHF